MFDVIWKKFGGVDVCINNAGISHAASLLDGDTKKWKNMTDVKSLFCIDHVIARVVMGARFFFYELH